MNGTNEGTTNANAVAKRGKKSQDERCGKVVLMEGMERRVQ